MNIAVNTRFLLKDRLEGIGWFTFETLKRMTTQHPEHQFFFFFDRPYDPQFVFGDNVTPVVINPPARHPILWYLWFEHFVPKALARCNADVFLSTDGFLSLRAEVPSVLVVHDIAFEHYPEHIDFMTRKYYQKFTPQYVRKATKVATVSEYSRQDIVRNYNISPGKIEAVYNGANNRYKPLKPKEKQQVKARYARGCDYFLFAGAIQPRKNVKNLFLAFDRFKRQHSSKVKLVIAGRKAWNFKEIIEAYESMEFRDEVIFVGHLSAAQLAEVMSSSLGLAYVSLFEGFGIPIIEAMSAGVPVITSKTSSMPEVAGDAALLVNPHSIPEIADAMLRLWQDPELRKVLVKKGHLQRQLFSWDNTADKLWAMVEGVLYGEKTLAKEAVNAVRKAS